MRLALPIMRKPSRPFVVLSEDQHPCEEQGADAAASSLTCKARRSKKKKPANSTTSSSSNLRQQIVQRHQNHLGSSHHARGEMICVETYTVGARGGVVTASHPTAQVMERVEVLLTYTKGQRVMKILCIHDGRQPVRHQQHRASSSFPDLEPASSLDDFVLPDLEEYAEHTTTFLEDFARSVLDPCQCQTFMMKSSLRKDKRSAGMDSRNGGIRNSVSFDTVDIKEFPMTLGDHPSAASGPPVALNWDHVERERSVKLDEYEANRSPRRNRRQLKLSLRDRKGILQKQFTTEQVMAAWSEAKSIREQRKETIQRGLFMMFMDDVVETTNRRVKRFGDSFSSILL